MMQTPLPWGVMPADQRFCRVFECDEVYEIGTDIHGVGVAVVPASLHNAEFIVRAVNNHDALLAACKAAAEWKHQMTVDVHNQLQAAIAKAEGR